jgi:hypothetical protein
LRKKEQEWAPSSREQGMPHPRRATYRARVLPAGDARAPAIKTPHPNTTPGPHFPTAAHTAAHSPAQLSAAQLCQQPCEKGASSVRACPAHLCPPRPPCATSAGPATSSSSSGHRGGSRMSGAAVIGPSSHMCGAGCGGSRMQPGPPASRKRSRKRVSVGHPPQLATHPASQPASHPASQPASHPASHPASSPSPASPDHPPGTLSWT